MPFYMTLDESGSAFFVEQVSVHTRVILCTVCVCACVCTACVCVSVCVRRACVYPFVYGVHVCVCAYMCVHKCVFVIVTTECQLQHFVHFALNW